MHYKLLFPNEFLAAADLRDKDVTLTIDRVVIESLKREKGNEDRPIVHFVEMRKRPKAKRKRWVLNKTNAKTIAKLYGTDVDAWTGCRITLYATECEAFGEMVECIRVRTRKPGGRVVAPPQEPEHEHDEGNGEDDEFGQDGGGGSDAGDEYDDDPTVGDDTP